MEQGLQMAAAGADDSEVARVVSEAIVNRRLLKLDYYKVNEDEFSAAHRRALRAHQRPRGLVRRRLRPRPRRRPPLPPGPHPRRRGARGGVRAASRGRSRRRRGGLAEDRRGRRPRAWPACGFPERARWAREERPVVAELSDGVLVVQLAYAGRRLAGARGAQAEAGTPSGPIEPASPARPCWARSSELRRRRQLPAR